MIGLKRFLGGNLKYSSIRPVSGFLAAQFTTRLCFSLQTRTGTADVLYNKFIAYSFGLRQNTQLPSSVKHFC